MINRIVLVPLTPWGGLCEELFQHTHEMFFLFSYKIQIVLFLCYKANSMMGFPKKLHLDHHKCLHFHNFQPRCMKSIASRLCCFDQRYRARSGLSLQDGIFNSWVRPNDWAHASFADWCILDQPRRKSPWVELASTVLAKDCLRHCRWLAQRAVGTAAPRYMTMRYSLANLRRSQKSTAGCWAQLSASSLAENPLAKETKAHHRRAGCRKPFLFL